MEEGAVMTGLERRAEMIEQIQRSAVPLSGKSLAETYGVSRQVIVQLSLIHI